MAKEALIIVDMSNDFVAEDGSLTAGKPAQEIVPYIVDLAKDLEWTNAFYDLWLILFQPSYLIFFNNYRTQLFFMLNVLTCKIVNCFLCFSKFNS
ncbi:hypothetical protein UACE39S_04369 [Ureibacillus acetophenoni]